MFPGACTLKFGQREKFALKIAPDWGIFLAGDEKGQRFSVPRATPHTRPGVLTANGQFWESILARNKQATAGLSRGGLGDLFHRNFFPFFYEFFLRIFQAEIFRIFFGFFFSDFFPYGGSSSGRTTSYAGIPIFRVLFWYYSSITTYPGL